MSGFAARAARMQAHSGPTLLPDARALFSPDPVDALRAARLRRAETPARALALAVMTQALIDLRHAGPGAKLYQETRTWFVAPDTGGPYTFEAICGLFEWDAKAVRRHVLGRHWADQEPVRQLRLVRRG